MNTVECGCYNDHAMMLKSRLMEVVRRGSVNNYYAPTQTTQVYNIYTYFSPVVSENIKIYVI